MSAWFFTIQHNNNPFFFLQTIMNHGYTKLHTPYNRGNWAPSTEPRGTCGDQSAARRSTRYLRPVPCDFFFFSISYPDWGTLLRTSYGISSHRNNRVGEWIEGYTTLTPTPYRTHTFALCINIQCNALHWYQPWQLNAPSNCHPPNGPRCRLLLFNSTELCRYGKLP